MALAHAVPAQLEQLKPWLKCQGFTGELHPLVCLIQSHAGPGVGSFCPIHRLAVGPNGVNQLDRRLFL